jgi:hypothetical protein
VVASNDESPPPSTRCALCDDGEPLTWVELATTDGEPMRVAVCSACYLDLSQREKDDDA